MGAMAGVWAGAERSRPRPPASQRLRSHGCEAMAAKGMTRTWRDVRPELVKEIEATLRGSYPNLHLHVRGGHAEIRGTFPVRAPDGRVLDRYRVMIELAPGFPRALPVVREVGGRLPWHEDFHIESDGKACVLIPADRWRCFPVDAPFRQYLEVPLHNFFLSQTVHAETGEWPFGQWGHGQAGIYDYYRWLFETGDDVIVRRVLHVLAKLDLKKHYECPCGSGLKIKKCCYGKLRELRRKIPPEVAADSVRRLGLRTAPYARSILR